MFRWTSTARPAKSKGNCEIVTSISVGLIFAVSDIPCVHSGARYNYETGIINLGANTSGFIELEHAECTVRIVQKLAFCTYMLKYTWITNGPPAQGCPNGMPKIHLHQGLASREILTPKVEKTMVVRVISRLKFI